MSNHNTVEWDNLIFYLSRDIDGVFFWKSSAAENSKDAASHQVHDHPDFVFVHRCLAELDQIRMTSGHNAHFSHNRSAVFSVVVKLTSFQSEKNTFGSADTHLNYRPIHANTTTSLMNRLFLLDPLLLVLRTWSPYPVPISLDIIYRVFGLSMMTNLVMAFFKRFTKAGSSCLGTGASGAGVQSAVQRAGIHGGWKNEYKIQHWIDCSLSLQFIIL